MSSGLAPSCSTAFQGSVSSTCSTPWVAMKAIRFPSSLPAIEASLLLEISVSRRGYHVRSGGKPVKTGGRLLWRARRGLRRAQPRHPHSGPRAPTPRRRAPKDARLALAFEAPRPGANRMATTAASPQITASDVLSVDRLLDDEERLIRETVRRFVNDRVLPNVADWFEEARIPIELAQELGKLGLLGMHLEGYGCAGASATAYGIACMELEA